MKVVLGSDHAGYKIKELIKDYLKSFPKLEVLDYGVHSTEPVDYPDIARKAAQAVAGGTVDRGILMCGTGIGMSITADKVAGIRAARCEDPVSAHLARAHNDANILTMGGRTIGEEIARQTVKAFLEGVFEGGHHERRVKKIETMDKAEHSRQKP